MAGAGGRFVGIGVGTYASAAYLALPRAVSDVQQLTDLLKGFEGAPLVDPTSNEASDHFRLLPDSMTSGGSLVLLWSGHGRPSVGDLRLITVDSPDNQGAGISAREAVRQAALSGAGQLLFIFDTCYSGTAVSSAASVAVALLQGRHRRHPPRRPPTHPPPARSTAMTGTDLVVVLPGILGSTLRRGDGEMVWAPSAGAVLRAIFTLAGSIKQLTLDPDIGDQAPDDGVEPVALMPDLHVLPGIWTPIKGYTRLLDKLTSLGYRTGANLLPVPYDWRLSNRYNGRRLAGIIEPALQRWRDQELL